MKRGKSLALLAVILFLATPFVIGAGVIGVVTLFGSNAEAACKSNSPGVVAPADGIKIGPADLSPEQKENARIIIGVAANRRLASRDAKLGLMVSYQESHFLNRDKGDLDSVGLYQQRSSWGSHDNRMNPVWATNKFFDALEAVPNRDEMSLLDVALAVQRPSRAAYLSPDNYFPGWESLADGLLKGYKPSGGSAPISLQVDCSSIDLAGGGVPGKVVVAPGANAPGRPIKKALLNYVARMAGLYGKPIVISTGTDHDYLTVDGNVSDHAIGYGADLGMVANGGTDDGPVGDALATACLVVAGVPEAQAARMAKTGGLWSYNRGNLRIQCIWKTDEGGNHHNHVHVGANPT